MTFEQFQQEMEILYAGDLYLNFAEMLLLTRVTDDQLVAWCKKLPDRLVAVQLRVINAYRNAARVEKGSDK